MEKTYTRAEILAAYQRAVNELNTPRSPVLFTARTAEDKTNALIKDMNAHRDPELDDEDIVIDATGQLWQYSEQPDMELDAIVAGITGAGVGFYAFGLAGLFGKAIPKRPIRKVDIERVKAHATE